MGKDALCNEIGKMLEPELGDAAYDYGCEIEAMACKRLRDVYRRVLVQLRDEIKELIKDTEEYKEAEWEYRDRPDADVVEEALVLMFWRGDENE